MVKRNFLTKMLLLCALIVGCVSSAWAEDPEDTFDFSSAVLTNNSISGTYCTLSVAKGEGSNDPVINSSKLRLYSKNTISFEAANNYAITNIVFTAQTSSSYGFFGNNDFEVTTGTFTATANSNGNEETGTWSSTNGETSVTFTSNKSKQFRFSQIVVTLTKISNDPSITAKDVTYDADVTSGTITYQIENTVTGKELTANTTAEWIKIGTITSSTVPFTMDQNTGSAREATVTLTYQYGDGANDKVTKDVKVTQNAYVAKYDIEINNMTNGSVVADVNKAAAGATVTLTITPSSGYKLATIAVIDADNLDVELSGIGNSRSFTMPAKAVTVSATFEKDFSITYDFSFASMGTKDKANDDWGGSYNAHAQDFPGSTVAFAAASKQTGTITDIPVVKNEPVTITLTDENATFKSATIALRHWTTKTITVTLYYSTDGGENWTSTGQSHSFTSSTSGEDVILTASALPAGTNALKIQGNASQQYGVASANVEVLYKVNIPTSGYGTYCSSNALNFEETEIKAYTAAYDATSGKVVLTKIDNCIVPAKTGVVLYSTTTGEQVVPATMTTTTVSSNQMVGVTAQTAVPWKEGDKYNYILQEGKFKKATGASLRANRAYLSTTYNVSPSGAPELDLAFGDETTGIQNVERTVNDNQYYTLDGRRVAQPTKGLYIVNGKKVVIK